MIERARLLRRLGRYADAAEAWEALAAGIGPFAPLAWIEVAKLHEHRLGDVEGALVAVDRAASIVARRRALGRPDPRLERQLAHRRGRLIGRLAAAGARSRSGTRRGGETAVAAPLNRESLPPDAQRQPLARASAV